ncbi:MAG: phage major capsid protein [Holosporaceae bacterium]|nr:phage major capsid protein [Holosporaceae bacterium]
MMNKEINDAISELDKNLDEFMKNNGKELNEMKANMVKYEDDRALRSMENFGRKSLPLSENLQGDSCQKSTFMDYIRNGSEEIFHKSLSERRGEEGAYLVPHAISKLIYNRLEFLSPIRSIAKVVRISTNAIDLLVDSKDADASWVAADHGNLAETNSPEIKKIQIPVHEIFAKPKASQRLLDDAQINAEEWLIEKIAEKISALENAAFVSGNDNNRPKGFLAYESKACSEREFGKLQHFSTGVDGNFPENTNNAMDILIDMSCSLRPMYVKNAKWVMSRSALAKIRKFRTEDGSSIWQPAIAAASPSTLLGYPVIIDDDMPPLETGKASTSLAFGDFYAGYQIVDRQGLKIMRDPYTAKPFVEFYASKRTGGAVVDFDAIKLLKFAA